MKGSLFTSACFAAALSLTALPSHAILIEEDKISSAEGILELISSLPAQPIDEQWFLAEGAIPDMNTIWRHLMLAGDTLGSGTTQGEVPPAGLIDPVNDGPVASVSEPPVALLLAAGLFGIIGARTVLTRIR